jgi:hypothetical protein
LAVPRNVPQRDRGIPHEATFQEATLAPPHPKRQAGEFPEPWSGFIDH